MRLNSDGTLRPLSVLKISNPSWIVYSHDYKFAYTTNEDDAGSVTALKVDKDGKLHIINQVESLGQQPTHATITHDGKYLLAANYSVAPNHAGFSVFLLIAMVRWVKLFSTFHSILAPMLSPTGKTAAMRTR